MWLERIEARHGDRPKPSLDREINDLLIVLAVERSRPRTFAPPPRRLSTRTHNLVAAAVVVVCCAIAAWVRYGWGVGP